MSGLNQHGPVNRHIVQRLYSNTQDRVLEMAGNAGTARAYLDLALRDLRDGDTPNAITMIERALERLAMEVK